LILDDEDSDVEAGRINENREENNDDTLMAKSKDEVIKDNGTDTETKNRQEEVQRATSKQARIN
jgi:hypothetical protein